MKSFRVFLHGNNLIAILAWFVWQGLLEGKVSITAQNAQEIVRDIGGEIRWTLRRYRYSPVFPSVRGFCKDVLPDSPKIAVINFDLTVQLNYFYSAPFS